ncbi:MAG: DUF819 family protein, partial [Planctomycetes bacterium]|nr:DUF819 family protein [Planctomycetota bacterium]
MPETLITSPAGIVSVLVGICALFFFLEKQTGWKLFNFLPPLLWIYLTPVVLSNMHVIIKGCPAIISNVSPVYGWMKTMILPMFLIILMLEVDVVKTCRIMGKGIYVMLFGTVGVILGAPIAYFIVKGHLGPESWKAFATLSGSWIGGTGQMAAAAEAFEVSGDSPEFGLAVLGDNFVYIVWLPIMLGSKKIAGWFNKFAKVDPKRMDMLEKLSSEMTVDKGKVEMRHILYLLFLGLFFGWVATYITRTMPLPESGTTLGDIFSEGTVKILFITTFGLLLSFTPAKKIPGSHALAMAFVFIYVANMGAKTNMAGLADNALWFLLGAFIWIF